jgi:hypothetical protein
MKDFYVIRKDRDEGRRGGLITAIKKSVYHQVLDFGSVLNQKMEVLLCRVYRYRKPALILANVYNPDGNNTDLETVFDLVKNAIKPTEEFLIVGDFNAHSGIWCGCGNKNGSGSALEKILEGQDEVILLTPYGLPTRANPHRGSDSTIDLAFTCGRMANKTAVTSEINSNLISDHFPVIVDIEGRIESPKIDNQARFIFKKANWKEYRTSLESIELENELNPFENIEDKICKFQQLLLETAEKIIPQSKLRKNSHREPIWWNTECENTKKAMNRAAITTIKFYLQIITLS